MQNNIEMNHFIDLNNNVIPTTMLHTQVFNHLLGKLLIMLFGLFCLVLVTSLGTFVLLFMNAMSYLWGKLFVGKSVIQIITMLCSIGTSVMLIMFFQEMSNMIDKHIERERAQDQEQVQEKAIVEDPIEDVQDQDKEEVPTIDMTENRRNSIRIFLHSKLALREETIASFTDKELLELLREVEENGEMENEDTH